MPIAKHHFSTSALYRGAEEHLTGFLSKRWSFWLALFSCFAFLVGNMVGQHGWKAFWKSVWGRYDDQVIVFTGTSAPVLQIPDPERSPGAYRKFAFHEIPQELLVALPTYHTREHCGLRAEADRMVYSVRYLGDYDEGGDGCGSHPGVDILLPIGTPIHSIANGIVDRVERRSRGFGNTVVIRHPNVPDPTRSGKTTTLYSVYAHLGDILLRKGDVVHKGEQIALSGQSGFATAPHLHFQLDKSVAGDEETPFHPYWPFSTADASKRNMSLVQAVNAGLGKSEGARHTVSPLLYVQQYLDFADEAQPVVALAPETVTVAETETDVISEPPPLTARERLKLRRAERLALRQKRLTERRASPVAQATLIASTSDSSLLPVITSPPAPKPVASLSIVHDGSFDAGWEQLVIFARDADGNFVRDVSFEGSVWLEALFGEAKFSPSAITDEQFDDRGRAFVRMLPSGHKTIVPGLRGTFTAAGEAMVRENVAKALPRWRRR